MLCHIRLTLTSFRCWNTDWDITWNIHFSKLYDFFQNTFWCSFMFISCFN